MSSCFSLPPLRLSAAAVKARVTLATSLFVTSTSIATGYQSTPFRKHHHQRSISTTDTTVTLSHLTSSSTSSSSSSCHSRLGHPPHGRMTCQNTAGPSRCFCSSSSRSKAHHTGILDSSPNQPVASFSSSASSLFTATASDHLHQGPHFQNSLFAPCLDSPHHGHSIRYSIDVTKDNRNSNLYGKSRQDDIWQESAYKKPHQHQSEIRAENDEIQLQQDNFSLSLSHGLGGAGEQRQDDAGKQGQDQPSQTEAQQQQGKCDRQKRKKLAETQTLWIETLPPDRLRTFLERVRMLIRSGEQSLAKLCSTELKEAVDDWQREEAKCLILRDCIETNPDPFVVRELYMSSIHSFSCSSTPPMISSPVQARLRRFQRSTLHRCFWILFSRGLTREAAILASDPRLKPSQAKFLIERLVFSLHVPEEVVDYQDPLELQDTNTTKSANDTQPEKMTKQKRKHKQPPLTHPRLIRPILIQAARTINKLMTNGTIMYKASLQRLFLLLCLAHSYDHALYLAKSIQERNQIHPIDQVETKTQPKPYQQQQQQQEPPPQSVSTTDKDPMQEEQREPDILETIVQDVSQIDNHDLNANPDANFLEVKPIEEAKENDLDLKEEEKDETLPLEIDDCNKETLPPLLPTFLPIRTIEKAVAILCSHERKGAKTALELVYLVPTTQRTSKMYDPLMKHFGTAAIDSIPLQRDPEGRWMAAASTTTTTATSASPPLPSPPCNPIDMELWHQICTLPNIGGPSVMTLSSRIYCQSKRMLVDQMRNELSFLQRSQLGQLQDLTFPAHLSLLHCLIESGHLSIAFRISTQLLPHYDIISTHRTHLYNTLLTASLHIGLPALSKISSQKGCPSQSFRIKMFLQHLVKLVLQFPFHPNLRTISLFVHLVSKSDRIFDSTMLWNLVKVVRTLELQQQQQQGEEERERIFQRMYFFFGDAFEKRNDKQSSRLLELFLQRKKSLGNSSQSQQQQSK